MHVTSSIGCVTFGIGVGGYVSVWLCLVLCCVLGDVGWVCWSVVCVLVGWVIVIFVVL